MFFDKKEGELVKVGAPMVRYSKLPFRKLIREYGTDVTFSPMILADSFSRSAEARDNELHLDPERDSPLIVQFASNRVGDFVESAKMVAPFVQGVDLNCGCPQGWAQRAGIGAALMENSQFVAEVVKSTKSSITLPDFTVSVKIRIHREHHKTLDFCKAVESAGADFITVHGRTKNQRSEPVDLEAVKLIKESLNIPVIANGDIKSLEDAWKVKDATGVDGVMAARGLLENPAMFAGYNSTPKECVRDWIRISLETGTPFTSFHHHLSYMLEKSLPRNERKDERRRQQAEAAERRMRESESRGIKDPEGYKRKMAEREKREKMDDETPGGAPLKWTVQN